ncbi:putative RNA polymerase II-associated factor 1 [Paratrimastix pyriformis]|uniref:RNA polymerase II-associated factor 1 n=1 Tax=Paratrimastix pyriformis TaxID=342808 RepID=A0ABQ8UD46_9EUKA|nr:putative RNA polymerase II-associated factor 1 [Paratrimastix pyriformis]
MKYRFSLPDIPGHPKLLTYPLNPNRYIDYFATSIEKKLKFELHTEPNMGIDIELINPDAYPKTTGIRAGIDKSSKPRLSAEDQDLLPDPSDAPSAPAASASTVGPRPQLPRPVWLRKPEYLSNDLYDTSAVRGDLDDEPKPPPVLTGTEHLQQIQESFVKARTVPRHPTKGAAVQAISVVPLLPDFDLWPNLYTQSVFDTDPIPHSALPPELGARRQLHSLIKAMPPRKGIKATAPDADVDMTSASDPDGEADPAARHSYEFAREYTYVVHSTSRVQGLYVIHKDPRALRYHTVHTRLELHKSKGNLPLGGFQLQGGAAGGAVAPGAEAPAATQPEPLLVGRRELTEAEMGKRMETLRDLEDEELGPIDEENLLSPGRQPATDRADSPLPVPVARPEEKAALGQGQGQDQADDFPSAPLPGGKTAAALLQ